MNRGVMYVIWGDEYVSGKLACRSIQSVKKFGLNTCLLTSKQTKVPDALYDKVIKIDFPKELNNLCRKTLMHDFSPFENTLFLDNDTVLLKNPEFGFEMSEKHGMCVSYAPFFHFGNYLNDAHREIIKKSNIPEEIIYYNTGVIFFNKSKTKKMFDTWKINSEISKSSNDQPTFAISVYKLGYNPFVLPHTWNFRGQIGKPLWIHGPIYIWHARTNLPNNLEEWNDYRQIGLANVQATGKGYALINYRITFKCNLCGGTKSSRLADQPKCCEKEMEVLDNKEKIM